MGTHTITQAEVNAGTSNNSATATGTPPGGQPPVTSPPDTTTTPLAPAPSLTIDKTTTTANYAAVGDTISYSYLVTNSGNVSLTGPVTVADDKTTVSCPAVTTVGNLDGELDPSESVTCTATYTVTLADLNSGSVTNIASATADGTTSPTDQVTVNATQTPALTSTKAMTANADEDGSGTVTVGDTLTSGRRGGDG
ncbi:hypothetical protein ASE35_07520 [Lysobacter sp. Root916]|uniref:DUF7507 domain-containing protein n=1 Tax=Lysobacter sp. Root916 TaxID=1736606 RepID=UPI000713BEDF|nr:hypothetical protein [Lysobacter sp. Root916]KRD34590.1 hypothetical protein ASE35_07520 [Lysobacter sp. Root916]